MTIWRAAVGAALAVMALTGCAYLKGLIPRNLEFRQEMVPDLPVGRGEYQMDPQDSSAVFSHEGAVVRVHPLNDAELNAQIPRLNDGRHVNPYTYADKDPDLRYVRKRFTVFDVTVENKTYPKVEFDPATAAMTDSQGREYRYYDAGIEGANPMGGNSFSKYYRVALGRSGTELQLDNERMGVVNKTIYHRERPVFKGDTRTGKLVFDPLPEDVTSVKLVLKDFVLAFDATGQPKETVDIEYDFEVKQEVVEVKQEPAIPDYY